VNLYCLLCVVLCCRQVVHVQHTPARLPRHLTLSVPLFFVGHLVNLCCLLCIGLCCCLQVVHVQHTPARLPRHLTPSLPLSDSTHAALAARGIGQLFVHQAAAVDALCFQRKHVVVATSTASGKSLCYNVPMLEALAHDRNVSGGYCFDPSLSVAWCAVRVCKTQKGQSEQWVSELAVVLLLF
jgi:hypothetical protein